MNCGAEFAKRHVEPSLGGGLRAAINRRLSRPAVYDSPETSKTSELQLADCDRIIDDLNSLVANFRDLLIHVGKSHDSPEVRDKMKNLRKKSVERCSAAERILLPQIRSLKWFSDHNKQQQAVVKGYFLLETNLRHTDLKGDPHYLLTTLGKAFNMQHTAQEKDVAEGIPVDSQHLVNLVCCTQLLLREIHKCKLLVTANPMDMTSFYERRPRSSGVAVLDKLILWRPPLHDYNQEELISIQRDIDTVSSMLNEMLDFMPQETGVKSLEDSFNKWQRRRKRALYRKCGYWSCFCRPTSTC